MQNETVKKLKTTIQKYTNLSELDVIREAYQCEYGDDSNIADVSFNSMSTFIDDHFIILQFSDVNMTVNGCRVSYSLAEIVINEEAVYFGDWY